MSDTGFVLAGTGASDSTVGTEPWANPGNITADDATYADGDAADKLETMEYILGTNFGLDLPADATIDGIEFRGQFHDTGTIAAGSLEIARVKHPSSGFATDQETDAVVLTGTPTDYDYGGATELHGASWTVANVEDSTFGVAFSLDADGILEAANIKCDALWVKVYYTESAGGRRTGKIYTF